MKPVSLMAAGLILAAAPAFAHTDGTAHVHSVEGLAWAIGIGLVATLACLAGSRRR